MKSAKKSGEFFVKKIYQKKFDQYRAEVFANLIHAPFGLARFDLDMNYVLVTDRWRQDYQIHEVNLIGKCHYDVFPEIPDHWKAIHKSGLSGEVIKGTEETFPRQDGRVDYVNWVVMPWHDFNQKICGIDILSEVVTARVEAQQEIKRLKSQLKKNCN